MVASHSADPSYNSEEDFIPIGTESLSNHPITHQSESHIKPSNHTPITSSTRQTSFLMIFITR